MHGESRRDADPHIGSDQDCRRLIGALRRPVYRGCFALIYTCGLRLGEAVALPVSAVDSRQMLLQVIGKRNKPCPWPSRYWSCCARSGRSIAITNTRIVALDDTHVTFKYKQRETGQWEVCRLTGLEFLRRFLMHVLPKGFHKLRHYGLWHPSKRDLQQRARLMLALLGRLLPAGRQAGRLSPPSSRTWPRKRTALHKPRRYQRRHSHRPVPAAEAVEWNICRNVAVAPVRS